MKKVLFIAIFALGMTTMSFAQTNERAAGVRLGYGGEFSYQHPLSSSTRLEVDLGLSGFKNSGFGVTGVYQWLFAENGGFNLYAGVGPGIGGRWESDDKGYAFGLDVVGQFGAEYNFDEVPVQISLDWSPAINIVPSAGGFGYERLFVSVRYRF